MKSIAHKGDLGPNGLFPKGGLFSKGLYFLALEGEMDSQEQREGKGVWIKEANSLVEWALIQLFGLESI